MALWVRLLLGGALTVPTGRDGVNYDFHFFSDAIQALMFLMLI